MIKILSKHRIGPHNFDVLSLLFGSLLGDCHAEIRSPNNTVRFNIKQSSRNVEYLMWFHKYLAQRGYCNFKKPVLKKIIGRNNKIYFYYRFNTYTYGNLFWFYSIFYKKKIKCLPNNEHLEQFLTPLALAVWFMDDGGLSSSGIKFTTHCFEKKDVERLVLMLKTKYDLNCSIHCYKLTQFTIYVPKRDMTKFSKIIKKYLVKSMHYKLGGY